jgi:beta-phosphoglucomutase
MQITKALLFDMDGTIVDNMSFHTDTWLELLRRREIETTAEEFFRNTAGMPNAQIFRHYFGDRLTEEEIVSLGAEKERIYRENYGPHVTPMPGLVALLELARERGIKTGLATSAPPENIEFILEKTGLRDAFDVIVGAQDVTKGKPDPEIYLVCAEKLGIDPGECVVFEDAPMGIESGLRAGMRVVALTTVLTADEAAAIEGIEGVLTDFVGCEAHV